MPNRRAVVAEREAKKPNVGASLSSRAGRTYATMPKSITQTSPRLTAGIVFLHAVEHQGPIQSSLIAGFDVLILGCEFQRAITHQAHFGRCQLRQLIDDFCRAHT